MEAAACDIIEFAWNLLGSTEESHRNLRHHSRCRGRNLNGGSPEYNCRELLLHHPGRSNRVTNLAFAWRYWGKFSEISGIIIDVAAEIWTEGLPNVSAECYCYTSLLSTQSWMWMLVTRTFQLLLCCTWDLLMFIGIAKAWNWNRWRVWRGEKRNIWCSL
jgi:hypothetical protein